MKPSHQTLGYFMEIKTKRGRFPSGNTRTGQRTKAAKFHWDWKVNVLSEANLHNTMFSDSQGPEHRIWLNNIVEVIKWLLRHISTCSSCITWRVDCGGVWQLTACCNLRNNWSSKSPLISTLKNKMSACLLAVCSGYKHFNQNAAPPSVWLKFTLMLIHGSVSVHDRLTD